MNTAGPARLPRTGGPGLVHVIFEDEDGITISAGKPATRTSGNRNNGTYTEITFPGVSHTAHAPPTRKITNASQVFNDTTFTNRTYQGVDTNLSAPNIRGSYVFQRHKVTGGVPEFDGNGNPVYEDVTWTFGLATISLGYQSDRFNSLDQNVYSQSPQPLVFQVRFRLTLGGTFSRWQNELGQDTSFFTIPFTLPNDLTFPAVLFTNPTPTQPPTSFISNWFTLPIKRAYCLTYPGFWSMGPV